MHTEPNKKKKMSIYYYTLVVRRDLCIFIQEEKIWFLYTFNITVMETNKTCGLAYFWKTMDVESSLIDGLHDIK